MCYGLPWPARDLLRKSSRPTGWEPLLVLLPTVYVSIPKTIRKRDGRPNNRILQCYFFLLELDHGIAYVVNAKLPIWCRYFQSIPLRWHLSMGLRIQPYKKNVFPSGSSSLSHFAWAHFPPSLPLSRGDFSFLDRPESFRHSSFSPLPVLFSVFLSPHLLEKGRKRTNHRQALNWPALNMCLYRLKNAWKVMLTRTYVYIVASMDLRSLDFLFSFSGAMKVCQAKSLNSSIIHC